jgi:hypothetical protein
VRAKVGRKIDISMIKNGSPYATYVTGSKAINVTTEWQRVEVTFTSNNTATDARIQINTGFDLWNDELYIYKPQLEERAPTPFVDGTRTDKVRDYSLSDHDATLLSASSPKWVDIGAGDGAYQFDGVDDYIDLGTDFTPKSSYTKMVWMKTTSSSARNLYSGSASEVMYLSGGAIQISNTWSSPTVSATTNFYDDKWHQIVSVYDGTNGYIYFDGNKLATGPLSSLPSGIQTYLGRYSNGSYYIGSIKEVSVYNRALTEAEIKHDYDLVTLKAE